MWAIIGGSGFQNFEGFETIELLDTPTPFGECSKGLQKMKIGDQEILFIPRHGTGHFLLPQEINYRANIFALKKWGASKIISISAVGSLQAEFKHGDMVVPDQYINWTKSQRAHTFCGDGIVGHVSLADPVSKELINHLSSIANELNFPVHFNKTYLCMEGPQFSTRAESMMYRQLHADVVGMTNFPEYALAREAGLSYLPCVFITDYDSWNELIPHATLPEILLIMKGNNHKAFQMVSKLIRKFPHILPQGCNEEGLKNGLMTPWDQIDNSKRGWLKILKGESE